MTAAVITLTPEQRELRARIRAFAEQEIKPIAAERDRIDDPIKTFPWEVWRKASRQGLRILSMPPKYGGIGMDVLTHNVVLEEICVADAAFGAEFHQVWKTQKILLTNPFLEQEILPKFLADDDYMFALGSTEPEAGSDNMLPYEGVDNRLRTSAVRQPDGSWLINGMKHFVSGGGIVKGIYLLCRTDFTRGPAEGTTMFFVETDTPGFRFGHIHSKMGWRMTPNAELIFDNVRVPDKQRIGEVGQGILTRRGYSRQYASGTAVFGIGTARAALEATLEMCRSRTRGGRPLIERQEVGLRLADIWTDIELARTLTWKAAWSAQYDPDYNPLLSMGALLASNEMVVRVCQSAMLLWGEAGARRDNPIEKLFRDSFANYHIDGVNDLTRQKIARSLAGFTGIDSFG